MRQRLPWCCRPFVASLSWLLSELRCFFGLLQACMRRLRPEPAFLPYLTSNCRLTLLVSILFCAMRVVASDKTLVMTEISFAFFHVALSLVMTTVC